MADDLIEKLWFCANLHPQCGYPENGKLFGAAADRITALQAQNRKLVEALRPFAARVKELSRSHLNINDGDEVLVNGKYLLAAYAAIAEAEKGEG